MAALDLAPLVGIFVGGQSRRMGGVPKGLLPAPGKRLSLVERLLGVVHEATPGSTLVLVGEHPAYAPLELPMLVDRPPAAGPLGGLRALLEHAEALNLNQAVALACDMPYLSAALLARLVNDPQNAALVAPKESELWQPFFARYRTRDCLTAIQARFTADHPDTTRPGRYSLQSLFRNLGATEFDLSIAERAELRDWDRPLDVEG